MAPDAEGQPIDAAGFGVVEPQKTSSSSDASPVPAGWLSEFDDGREKRELDAAVAALRRRERLVEDADLVDWLASQGFAGRDYERFATELAKYGFSVLVAWIRRGLIFARC